MEKGYNMCKLNPKVDLALKKLFGCEENKDILMSFINSMVEDNRQITYLELKNHYSNLCGCYLKVMIIIPLWN